jgi:hypothetical protein
MELFEPLLVRQAGFLFDHTYRSLGSSGKAYGFNPFFVSYGSVFR